MKRGRVNENKYTEEFKEEAIALAERLGNFSAAARQLGIGGSLLHSWKEKSVRSVKGKAEGEAEARGEAALELSRLRKENEELKKINLVLKRAAAFFSQDHLS